MYVLLYVQYTCMVDASFYRARCLAGRLLYLIYTIETSYRYLPGILRYISITRARLIPYFLSFHSGPRECFQCGRYSRYECRDCFEVSTNRTFDQCNGLQRCAFCEECVKKVCVTELKLIFICNGAKTNFSVQQ